MGCDLGLLLQGCVGSGDVVAPSRASTLAADSAPRSQRMAAVISTQKAVRVDANAPAASGAQTRWIWNAVDALDEWVAFRKSFTLEAVPSSAKTYIAADTHHWLWVNGRLVVFEGGPKRGPHPTDTRCDEIDLAPYLQTSKNTFAVLVWHFGKRGELASSHLDSRAAGLLFESTLVAVETVAAARDSALPLLGVAALHQRR